MWHNEYYNDNCLPFYVNNRWDTGCIRIDDVGIVKVCDLMLAVLAPIGQTIKEIKTWFRANIKCLN